MNGERRRGGWSNPASADNGLKAKGQGRPVTKAIIRDGDGIMISRVFSDGGYADYGKGIARIEGRGHSRIIVIPQDDGSEIRILVVR